MTSDAMITICTIMRIELGIWLRIIEMNRLEKPVTSVSAIDITSAVCRFDVTASAEQMPRICRPIGLLAKTGLNRTSLTVGLAIFKPPGYAAGRAAGRSPAHQARIESGGRHRCWSA